MLRPPLLLLATILSAVLCAGAPARALGAETTVTVNATVLEVQCTPEQRTRIRACAPAVESFSTESAKFMVAARADLGLARRPERDYEVRRDPNRPVLIKTVLY